MRLVVLGGATILVVAGSLSACVGVWPSGWHEVQVGATRSELVATIGEPSEDTGEIKGACWHSDRLLVRFRLNAVFDSSGKLAAFAVTRDIGTRNVFHHRILTSGHGQPTSGAGRQDRVTPASRDASRPNNRLDPTVGPVTAVASATAAPAPPAGQPGRSAD